MCFANNRITTDDVFIHECGPRYKSLTHKNCTQSYEIHSVTDDKLLTGFLCPVCQKLGYVV